MNLQQLVTKENKLMPSAQESKYIEIISEIYARFPEYHKNHVVNDELYVPDENTESLYFYGAEDDLMKTSWILNRYAYSELEKTGEGLQSCLDFLREKTDNPSTINFMPGYFALAMNKTQKTIRETIGSNNCNWSYIYFYLEDDGSWDNSFEVYAEIGWGEINYHGEMSWKVLDIIDKCLGEKCVPSSLIKDGNSQDVYDLQSQE